MGKHTTHFCFYTSKGSVEMAYGTPYLLSLGLSKSHMSLVWIAGPLSGLIMQPVVGVLSDRSTSQWGRRRPFMIGGSMLVALTLLVIGWTKEIAGIFVSAADDAYTFKVLSIVIGILSIYVLDFSINCVQASCRALIVDALSPSQQELGTAWAGRMIGLGNVAGYFMGYADLAKVFPFLGDTQLKVLCVFASLVLLGCDAITCYAVQEAVQSRQHQHKSHPLKTIKDIMANIWHLPRAIQQVCNVQFFAWIGWFPFLFYSTTWVAEIYAKSTPLDDHRDAVGQATRAGSFSFLVYSLVSLASSFLLPIFVRASAERNEMSTRVPPYQCLTLPEIWTASHFLFCAAMLSTWFVNDVLAASLVIGICGVSWAVSMWAPFSLIGETIAQIEQQQERVTAPSTLYNQRQARLSKLNLGATGIGTSGGTYQLVGDESEDDDDAIDHHGHPVSDARPLLFAAADEEGGVEMHDLQHASAGDAGDMGSSPDAAVQASAGVYLGIHNMYIVLPQFLVTFLSSILFHVLESGESDTIANDDPDAASSDAIGVVLRFGAVMAAIAGFISFRIK
ncbi:major facilitator superfamily domain-containing protein [Gongronella butleri]|nr:major facilitator superfamily domain-containing protein [Gongronella butleri]